MSYILEALRRAEADRERERGQVPGLHTQALLRSEAAAPVGQRRWLPWAGSGLLLLLAGMGAGSWWADSAPKATAPAALPVPQPQTPATSAQAPEGTAPQAAASGSPYLPPAPPPIAATAARTPAAGAAAIPPLSALAESTRRDLPKLAIAGLVYSDDPRSRFVIINGEVLREGAPLGADLVLEQIRPRELVLRFKGQRYRQPV